MYTSVPGSSHVCLQDSCMLVKAQFFLFLDYILFHHTTGLACLLTNSAAENTLVPVFWWMCSHLSWAYTQSAITGSQGICVFTFPRHCKTFLCET